MLLNVQPLTAALVWTMWFHFNIESDLVRVPLNEPDVVPFREEAERLHHRAAIRYVVNLMVATMCNSHQPVTIPDEWYSFRQAQTLMAIPPAFRLTSIVETTTSRTA